MLGHVFPKNKIQKNVGHECDEYLYQRNAKHDVNWKLEQKKQKDLVAESSLNH